MERSEGGIRIPYPYLSVRFEKKELVENFVMTLIFVADTILSELGYTEINEQNVGDVIKLLRKPLFRLDEIKKLLSDQQETDGENLYRKDEDGGDRYEAEEGIFVSKPEVSVLFEYPLTPDESKKVIAVSERLVELLINLMKRIDKEGKV